MQKDRPIHHQDQILSTSELKVGDKIIWNNIKYGSGKPEIIISFGYYPVNRELKKYFRTINYLGFISENFNADYGLEPYTCGNWNPSNFTLKIKE